jgi:hypothetical protein
LECGMVADSWAAVTGCGLVKVLPTLEVAGLGRCRDCSSGCDVTAGL